MTACGFLRDKKSGQKKIIIFEMSDFSSSSFVAKTSTFHWNTWNNRIVDQIKTKTKINKYFVTVFII